MHFEDLLVTKEISLRKIQNSSEKVVSYYISTGFIPGKVYSGGEGYLTISEDSMQEIVKAYLEEKHLLTKRIVKRLKIDSVERKLERGEN